MAPNRRKGSGKSASSAAATRRQWKVGDLVLAKVKGFPAWPATVSEPEKWGYSADWRKVLVYFFGTKQIAFCNPADVEAFTEDKKESLLTKRQGKGADFVRAVQEIIDSYEKLKKQDRVDEFNSGNEDTVTNAGNSVDSVDNVGLKDQTETPAETLSLRIKTSFSTRDRNDPSLPVEDAAAGTQIDALHDTETLTEGPPDNALVTETPLATTYSSRKRSRGMQPQSCVTQRRAPSVRRSRSSLRVDSCRFQNFTMPSNDGDKSAGDIASNITRDGSLKKNKRIRKSPDASVCCDADSPAFVSNGSIEDDGSEIATVDSDTLSFNEGSTMESGCKLEHTSAVVECLEGDVELSKRLDLQSKAVVIKKKRKPNRKRITNDAAELTARLDKGAGLEVGVHKTRQISPNACEISNERYSKEDGDEHLPLVKRARVRMGKPSSVGVELDSFMQTEEKSTKELPINLLGQVCTSFNCDDDGPADRSSFLAKGAMDNSPPLNNCSQFTETRPQFWKVKKNKPFGCSVDGEAALPPSKRLHRALEAMSANAADDGQACTEAPSTMETCTNGYCVSSTRGCPHMAMESKVGSDLGVQNVDCCCNNALQDGMSGFSTSLNRPISEETEKSSVGVDLCSHLVRNAKSPKHEFCKDMFVEAMNGVNGKDHCGSSFDTHTTAETVVQVQNCQPLLPNLDGRQASFRSDQGSLNSKDEGKSENFELSDSRAEQLDQDLGTLEHTRMSPDPDSGAEDIAKVSPRNGINVLYSADDNCCENTKFLKPQLDENSQVNGMCEVVNKVKCEATQKDISAAPSPIPMKVMTASGQGAQQLFRSSSISDDHLSDKDASGVPSSPFPTDGIDSPARASPPNTSICHTSTTDKSDFLQINGCCSPNVELHQGKTVSALDVDGEGKFESMVTHRPKSLGKWSNHAEGNAVLTSFEAMLGALTRTKESIGRATRVAIDCAKFGIAAEVVEILARKLESESSLHRRVDLFFLVDSITQCSRGLKGEFGGIYPSAIQAVLPRLLSAAAPPGNTAQENRRQCLKVLRLWLERRILPESIIRRHIRDLDSFTSSSSSGAFSRRQARTERALNDPLREMEGMLVDEYGSNSSFQLPGFCMPRMLKDDEGSDSDGGSFEAVTPEHNSETPEERETISISAIEKHRHILEDVDGELEMEDVAPSCEVEMSSTSNVAGVNSAQTSHQFEQHFPLPFAPPLPNDMPPSSPPLPTSPPPPPPPPPPPLLPPPSALSQHFSNGVDSKLFMGTHNMQDNLQQSMAQQSVAPRINPTISDVVHYHAPECKDFQMQIPDSTGSCSLGSFPVSHPPIRPVNNAQQTDAATLHNKAYHLRPPHPAPSNQFSYVQAEQQVQSRREAPPPSYSNRFHFVQSMDCGNFYSDRDRMKLAPHDLGESWRFSAPSFSGSLHPDKAKASYAPVPQSGPPCEPTRIPDQGWAFPPRAVNHRNSVPIRPPSEAPSFWRPR